MTRNCSLQAAAVRSLKKKKGIGKPSYFLQKQISQCNYEAFPLMKAASPSHQAELSYYMVAGHSGPYMCPCPGAKRPGCARVDLSFPNRRSSAGPQPRIPAELFGSCGRFPLTMAAC